MAGEHGMAMRRFWENVNAGQYEALDQLVSNHYHDHFPRESRAGNGRESMKEALRRPAPGIIDPRYDIEAIVEGEDTVVTRFTIHSGQGAYAAVLPPGMRLHLEGLYLCRFEDGRIIEGGVLVDDLPLLRQLAVSPA